MASDNRFITVAITPPLIYDGEEDRIASVLENGFDYVHLRKPQASLQDLRHLIERIDPALYPRLRLHDCFSLALEYSLGGIHLNGRNPSHVPGIRSVSRSCHSLPELDMDLPSACFLEYQTLSPIFDSISKCGYHSRFNIDDITSHIRGKKVIALGGVTPDKRDILKAAGFYGMAMLGAAWK